MNSAIVEGRQSVIFAMDEVETAITARIDPKDRSSMEILIGVDQFLFPSKLLGF